MVVAPTREGLCILSTANSTHNNKVWPGPPFPCQLTCMLLSLVMIFLISLLTSE